MPKIFFGRLSKRKGRGFEIRTVIWIGEANIIIMKRIIKSIIKRIIKQQI